MVENSSDFIPRAMAASTLTFLSSRKSVSSGQGAEFLKRVEIDCRVRLGDAQLIAPDEHVEVFEPLEFALDALKD